MSQSSHPEREVQRSSGPHIAPIFDEDERKDASLRYRHGLSPEDAVRQPYYQALSLALSEDELAVDLLCEVPLDQRNSMLILAALHYGALSGHPILAPLYGTLNTPSAPTPQFFASEVLRALHQDPRLVRDELHRQTQTNEVGRSAVLQAVLRELRRRGVHDVNLVDVGTSAGLNLYVDHYPVSPVEVDDVLTLWCESLRSDDQPGDLPRIHSRIGLDRNPLDLTNPDDALWLRACLWPENPQRLARLELIERLAPSWPALALLRGDALANLEHALAMAEPGVATVVMHTWVAAYFSDELQHAFAARMRELVATSDVYWVYLEWPRAVSGLEPPPAREDAPRPGASQIVVTSPSRESEHWGWCHAHGRWLSLSLPAGPKA